MLFIFIISLFIGPALVAQVGLPLPRSFRSSVSMASELARCTFEMAQLIPPVDKFKKYPFGAAMQSCFLCVPYSIKLRTSKD